jgi:hypothetical protein
VVIDMKKKIIICVFSILILITAIVFIIGAIQSYNYDITNNPDDKWVGFGSVLTLMVGGFVVFYEFDLFYTAYYFLIKPKTIAKSILNKYGKEVDIRDEEGIINKTIAVTSAIKSLIDDGFKIKGVIVDGVSFLLEYAEAKMRLERNIAPDGGVNMLVWKVRNQFFREFYSPYMGFRQL